MGISDWSSDVCSSDLGIAVLRELVRQAAAALPGWDYDVIEAHHTHKRDAPSGTALALGAAVTAGRGSDPHYCSIRAGDIVGEHTVMLTAAGERLELVHRASNRSEERRVGKACVSTWRTRDGPYH